MLEINMGKSNGLRDMGSGGFLQGNRGSVAAPAQTCRLPAPSPGPVAYP